MLPIPVYQQNDFTPKRVVVSHLYYAVAKFHTREKFSLWYNNRGEPTPGWLARHDLWWWYHETNTEPQEGIGVILDVSYWRCRGVPSERMKSRPGVEPRTCRCWVRARVGQRSRFLVQGLLDDGHLLDCDGLALTPIWALVTFDTPQHTEGNQPAEKADPPQCEGTGLLKGKPLWMNGGEYWQDDSRNGWARLHWLEELIPKEKGYFPEHRNPRSGIG